jgi:pyruvate/2-oxoglutarate dehydrogenase complex dihydrolipoamide acyltransferase (E2) component
MDDLMRVPIVVPDVRPGNEPLTISSWFVEEGDFILAGDLVLELLIPGVTFDVTSNASGRLVEVVKPVDALTTVGEIVGWIEAALPEEPESLQNSEND